MKTLAAVLTLFLALQIGLPKAFAQQRFTVSGYVKDQQNGESLIGISISKAGTSTGTVTNEYGFYSLTLPAGEHELQFSYIGYSTQKIKVNLKANQKLDVKLVTSNSQLNEVVISTKQQEKNINTLVTSVNKLSVAEMKKLPTFMGEVDVLRAIQTLPGVTTVGEGSSGFNVRGGATDENLILLDEAPVYNATHMLGFFSVFNPDAVKSLNLMKGGFPAEYGGRTSSVLDIRMKDGNNQKTVINGGISNVFSRLSIEGPLQKDKSSFIVAGRRSYVDVLMKPFLKGDLKDTRLYFYDLTAKANFQLNKNNSLFVSGYFGRDVFGLGEQAKFNWGNTTTSIRWNHIFNDRLFLNLTTYYSQYDYSLSFASEEDAKEKQGYDWTSNIINYGVKPAFTYYINSNNSLHFGLQSVYYKFKPGKGVGTEDTRESVIELNHQHALESGIYLDHEFKVSPKLGIQYGARVSGFQYMGKGTAYYYADTTAGIRKRLIGQKEYGAGEVIKDYYFFEPRFSARYAIDNKSAVKLAYARTSQFMHQLSNTASPTPLDIWTPSTNNIEPQVADQVTAGYFYSAPTGKWEASAEVFYKKMHNQLDYIDNAKLQLNQLIEADLLPSEGRAYGIELYAKKEVGKTTGWVSYTLSRSERKTMGISQNEWFLNRYDRTHNLNVVVNHEVSKRGSVSANFIYASGTPGTFADARLEFQDWDIPYNTTEKRNNYRLPAFHRLDLSYTLKGKQTKRWKGEWVFSLYNVYARRNAYTIYFKQNDDDKTKKEAVRMSIIGSIIPGITYNFKF
ncbi:outer membrane receptor protein involved in Fe transport [Chitinophaga skermanii]|uniref:Outer membrane receptor protein involved in Fe transport n=1 Tax=Chitinophaga skermanii TaxID=331697 RepID=A0A327Q700_9BACT|nr:carboxypeptidase-like regulatory domain-containing protein [Chitinophaga skermanii]RAJ00356.1 outer membrane receptor protein involved in Fe transport [Chitinophaga skermanii]